MKSGGTSSLQDVDLLWIRADVLHEVGSSEASGSTCDIPDRSHRRTATGPEWKHAHTRHHEKREIFCDGSDTTSLSVTMLTSFSEVPHRLQDLHSMHCH
ncbi:hypothetical protein CCH79_00000113 [Gambusia affinis]|uniref:Uncharacterized protein n=1 Tax=Gambusia affinis TaxID=33528 RepID=A0A315VW59_GAMAF|nr:hypothetical protein CCH79_00000113 [Gambusia affinis]